MDPSTKSPVSEFRRLRWLALAVPLGAPFIVSDFYLYYVNLFCIYSILSIGLNFIQGFTHLINFGYAGLFGIGAYSTATCMMLLDLPYLPSLLIGASVAAFVGFLLAIPGVRMSQVGFALLTFAFGETIVTVIGQIKFLGQYNGLMFPKSYLVSIALDGNVRLFYLYYISALILFFVFLNLIKSRIGRAFIATADSSVAAQSLGVNLSGYQILSVVISSFYAGVAGALYGPLVTFIDPASFDLMQTILVFMMVIVGGVGTYFGPIIGSALLIFMPELLRELNEYQNLVYGAVLLIFIIFIPQGIWGFLSNSILSKIRSKQQNDFAS